MNTTEITQKHMKEISELEAMQQSEIANLIKRHRINALEAGGKYFEKKREEQMQRLLQAHRLEKARLFDTQEKEWQQLRKIKQIIRESQQLSFDLQPKPEPQPEPKVEEIEEKNILRKVLKKIKYRSQQQ